MVNNMESAASALNGTSKPLWLINNPKLNDDIMDFVNWGNFAEELIHQFEALRAKNGYTQTIREYLSPDAVEESYRRLSQCSVYEITEIIQVWINNYTNLEDYHECVFWEIEFSIVATYVERLREIIKYCTTGEA